MSHLILLGDSIFDNAAYVRGGQDVVTRLRGLLPDGWRATLGAVDGAVIDDVRRQVAGMPADATHVVLSIGGNDALGHAALLNRAASSSAQVLGWFADAVESFESRYRRMLDALEARRLPVALCTIYNGNLGEPTQRLATTALALFNDVITRVAIERELPLIELRRVCDDPADYVNAIEPSERGGEKIAHAIVTTLLPTPRFP